MGNVTALDDFATWRLRVRVCLVVLLTATAGSLVAADPVVTGLFPPVLTIGGDSDLTVSGSGLGEIRSLVVAIPGLVTRSVKKNRLSLRVSADAIPGDHDAWTLTSTGLTNPLRIRLVNHPVVVVTEGKDSDAVRLTLPGSAAARLDRAADLDRFVFTGRRDQPISISCRSRSLDGSVAPILLLSDPGGRELAHSRSHLAEPVLTQVLPADGDYQVSVVDRTFQRGKGSTYVLTLKTGPRLITTVPSAVTADDSRRVTLWGFGLPGGQPGGEHGLLSLPVTVSGLAPRAPHLKTDWPDRRPLGSLQHGWRFQQPGVNGATWLTLSEEPVVRETGESNDTLGRAQPLNVPVRVCGRFRQPGDIDWFVLDARKEQPLEIVTWGERLGQAMQLEVIVHDKTGKPLTTFKPLVAPKGIPFDVPLTTTDPQGLWKPPSAGTFYLLVRDIYGGSLYGLQRSYQLVIGPPRQRFDSFVLVGDGKTSSGLSITTGQQATLQVIVLRQGGFAGPVTLKTVDLPEGISADPVTIAADKPTGTLILKARHGIPATTGFLRVLIEGQVEGRVVQREARAVVRVPDGTVTTRVADGVPISVIATTPSPPPPPPKPRTTKA